MLLITSRKMQVAIKAHWANYSYMLMVSDQAIIKYNLRIPMQINNIFLESGVLHRLTAPLGNMYIYTMYHFQLPFHYCFEAIYILALCTCEQVQ